MLTILDQAIKDKIVKTFKTGSVVPFNLINPVKDTTIESLKAAGDVANLTFSTVLGVSKGTILGLAERGISIIEVTADVVKAVMLGAHTAGKDESQAAKEAVKGVVLAADESGEDAAKVAVEAVKGATEGAMETNQDVEKVSKGAISGALEAANEIGGSAGSSVRTRFEKNKQKSF